jgi:hypothetical protein
MLRTIKEITIRQTTTEATGAKGRPLLRSTDFLPRRHRGYPLSCSFLGTMVQQTLAQELQHFGDGVE